MSNTTREINKITTTIIRISVTMIVYAFLILLLYEAVIRGYAFGHAIFYAEAVDAAPGTDMQVEIGQEETIRGVAKELYEIGLIKSEFAFWFQSKFYEYDTVYAGTYLLNTSMTSKEILETLTEKPLQEESAASLSQEAADEETQESASGEESQEETQAEEIFYLEEEEDEGGWY